MTPIICPGCGSEATILINDLKKTPAEPDQQLSPEAAQNQQTASEAKLPVYHCNNCSRRFGGDHTAFEKSTIQITLNTYKKGEANQALIFTKTPAGATIEGPFICYYPDLPEIYINHEDWERLLAGFYDLYVLDWKADYSPSESAFDFGWALKIKFAHQEAFSAKGDTAYPPYWESLMDLFISFGLPNIGKKLGLNFLQLGTAR